MASPYPTMDARWPTDNTEAGKDGPAPAGLGDLLEKALARFQRNLDTKTETHQDGSVWELEKSRTQGDTTVHHARLKTSSAWNIRVQCKAPKATCQQVWQTLGVQENKMKWDKESVAWCRRLKCFSGPKPGDRIDIEAYISLPHLGGLVKPRYFLEARLTRFEADGSILSAVHFIDPAASWAGECCHADFDGLAKKLKLTAAKNLPGCGIAMMPYKDGGCKFFMVMHTELGGWLPSGPVNSESGGILAGLAQQGVKVATAMPKEESGADGRGAGEKSKRDSAGSTSNPGRRRVRIRAPGCSAEELYGWRWLPEAAVEAAA